MRASVIVLLVLSALLYGCAAHTHMESPAATPIPTAGLALAPAPPIGWPKPNAALMARVARARTCGAARAQEAIAFHSSIYVGCSDGKVVRLNQRMERIRARRFGLSFVNVRGVGKDVLAVSWVEDGASLVNRLLLVNAATLRPIIDQPMSDSTLLGVIGDRAYIDDWCCNGRADVYEPATIYSISLKDGTSSERIDLAPDPQTHPGSAQPLGQGEWNYLIGTHLYVVVQDTTYRYDMRHLNRPPAPMKTFQHAVR
jgi:hypothetical protein